jgi:hypothetical protein
MAGYLTWPWKRLINPSLAEVKDESTSLAEVKDESNAWVKSVELFKPSQLWGKKIDRAVMVYIDRVAWCVRGYDTWNYETNRYYGDDGLKVRECRHIYLPSCLPTRDILPEKSSNLKLL